ncbi:hypothetical protein SSS_01682 [Sarcoptes scabiei]|nr:hypothetical protein SSS_01682 [Sarcoptes scabiei]
MPTSAVPSVCVCFPFLSVRSCVFKRSLHTHIRTHDFVVPQQQQQHQHHHHLPHITIHKIFFLSKKKKKECAINNRIERGKQTIRKKHFCICALTLMFVHICKA